MKTSNHQINQRIHLNLISKEENGYYNIYDVNDIKEDTIAKIPIRNCSEEIAETNKRLFINAPELLKACIKANQYLAYLASEGKISDYNEVDNWSEVQQLLSNTIKQSTSE